LLDHEPWSLEMEIIGPPGKIMFVLSKKGFNFIDWRRAAELDCDVRAFRP
jgi:hypothetical protein